MIGAAGWVWNANRAMRAKAVKGKWSYEAAEAAPPAEQAGPVEALERELRSHAYLR